MELIFNNQLSILIDILPFYLTPKQYTKLYTSNLILYNIYLKNNKFENNYFTPKTNKELYTAVNKWCNNRKQAIIKYGYISYWNTIYITNMAKLFSCEYNFNDNISDWNISNVINMEYMFYNTKEFNQNLNKWNIKNVKYINHIFYNNKNFNRLNCKDWNLNHILDDNKRCMYNNSIYNN